MKKIILTSALMGLMVIIISLNSFAHGFDNSPAIAVKIGPKHFLTQKTGSKYVTATLHCDKGFDFKKYFEVTITQNNLICGIVDIRKLADGIVFITASLNEDTKPTEPIVLLIRPHKEGGVMEHVTVADICGAEPTNSNNSISISLPKPTGLGYTSSGNSEFISIPGGGPSGSGAASPGSKINLFPNPAIDEINIVTEGEVMWGVGQVVDLSGKVVKNFTISDVVSQNTNFVKVNLSDLNTGIYFIRFKTDKETYAKRIQIIK
jgi:hypothetical protein